MSGPDCILALAKRYKFWLPVTLSGAGGLSSSRALDHSRSFFESAGD